MKRESMADYSRRIRRWAGAAILHRWTTRGDCAMDLAETVLDKRFMRWSDLTREDLRRFERYLRKLRADKCSDVDYVRHERTDQGEYLDMRRRTRERQRRESVHAG
jgi:hypothetical protein